MPLAGITTILRLWWLQRDQRSVGKMQDTSGRKMMGLLFIGQSSVQTCYPSTILRQARLASITSFAKTTRTNQSMCYLELIGTRTVSKPGSKGEGKRTYPYKLTCVQCKKAKRRPPGSERCYRSIWRCARHPECVLCPAKDRTCFAEHCDLYVGVESE